MTPEEVKAWKYPILIILFTLTMAYMYFGNGSNNLNNVNANNFSNSNPLMADFGNYATCIFEGEVTKGQIDLVQKGNTLHLTGTIEGLLEGKHGFHIHQFGNLGDRCKAAGGHFNPFGVDHGGPDHSTRHHGDLGNIIAGPEHSAVVDIQDKFASLPSIIGRSLVVHVGEDDLGLGGKPDSKKTGAAGGRLACCVIGMSGSKD